MWYMMMSAQPSPGYMHKLSPRLQEQALRSRATASHSLRYIIQCTDTALLQQLATAARDSLVINYRYGNVIMITAHPQLVYRSLLPLASVSFVDDGDRKASEEVRINGFDNTVNHINTLHRYYPSLTVAQTVVSVKENEPDTADIDFKGRFISTPLSSHSLSSHATIMGTIIAGGGNSFYTARGVAPGAGLCSSSFAVLLPDSDAAYRRYQVSVQNHSYGTGIENYYGADAAAYDASVNNNPSLLHVFSSGNSGDQASASGPYKGISGLANLTGSFKMAKNILTVGSIDSFVQVPLLSSKGPAYDGRIKPELVAFGEDGSSGAAALVSGTALLLQQAYKDQHAGAIPDAALVKAVLLNSAAEAGSPGIDFSSGFGSLDAWRAVKEMQAARFFSGTAAQGQPSSFSFSLPAHAQHLKVLLCWTDKPAPANAAKALVNDLDLTLTHTASAQSWQPWVLNSAAVKDSLLLLPVRTRDSLNTVEQVSLDAPQAGDYTITVNGYSVPAGTQAFYVVYQWDSTGSFAWTWPMAGDNLLPGQDNVLRWQTNSAGSGLPEYRLAGSSQWQAIQPAASLNNQYMVWHTPDTTATALLRMTINGTVYVSDSFTLSPRPATGVGFNCPDSFLLYWDKNRAATGYVLYRLGAQYMEPVLTGTDTAVILPVSAGMSYWWAVAPLLSYNKTGLRSFAFDYTQQGVDCYINNFRADLNGTAAALRLDIGSSYRVTAVSIEKKYAGGYRVLQSFGLPVQFQYGINDTALTQGVNTYRAKITLANGRFVYSDEETVYYSGGSHYLIYPNPVAQSQPIHIITTSLDNAVFRLYDVWGRIVMEKILYNFVEGIPTGGLVKGIYFYSIIKDGRADTTGKIIVQ